MGDRTVCFIDKETGCAGICTMEGLDYEQLKERFPPYGVVDCKQCSFYKKYKGKEKDYFSFVEWVGELK